MLVVIYAIKICYRKVEHNCRIGHLMLQCPLLSYYIRVSIQSLVDQWPRPSYFNEYTPRSILLRSIYPLLK